MNILVHYCMAPLYMANETQCGCGEMYAAEYSAIYNKNVFNVYTDNKTELHSFQRLASLHLDIK